MRITVINAKGYAEADSSSLPKLLASKRDIVWVDFVGPRPEDIKAMEEVFQFHPLAIEDTTNTKQQPKIEHYPGFTLCIMNSIMYDGDSLVAKEIDIFVGKNYIVTVHAEADHSLDEAYNRVARGGVLAQITPGYLLYMIIDSIIDGYFPALDAVTDRIETLEDITLFRPRRDTLNEIFVHKRTLMEMWRVVWPEREMLSVLAHESPNLDMNALGPYMRDVIDHLLWIGDMIQTQRELALGIVDLYMSTVSNQLNRVVNRLTIVTVFIGMLTVIGGFYGMNFEHTWPPFGAWWGVPLVIVMMLAIGIGVWIYFRWQEWG